MEWLKILPLYIQAAAIVVGAGWAYWKFIYQRQKEPATDIDIDVRFVSVQQEKWIIEVTCALENKSLVRHTYRDFRSPLDAWNTLMRSRMVPIRFNTRSELIIQPAPALSVQ